MKRLERWTPLALGLVCLAVTVYASIATSLAIDELGVLAQVSRSAELVKRIAERGLSQLFAPDVAVTLAGPSPGLLTLAAGWAKLSLGRAIDPLTSVRLPWLLLSAAAPLAAYGITAPSRGRVVGVLAALGLLFLPRWLHGSVVLSEGVLVASLWMLVLVAYVRSQARDRSRYGWAIAGGAALGFGTALSFATLWALGFVLAHFVLTRFRVSLRMAKSGRIPLPLVAVAGLIVGPVTFLLASPVLWKATSPAIVRHVLSPLGPSIAPSRYFAREVKELPVPSGFTLRWLLETTPLVLLLLALVGVVSIVHALLARRFASGALRPARDRTGLGPLVLLGLCATLFGALVTPAALTTFPPRAELALPFVAIAAALGLERMVGWVRPVRLRCVPAALVMVLLGVSTLSGVRTLGASFAFSFGGARGALVRRSFRVSDGSELGPLLHEITKRGVTRFPPNVPPALFSELASLRRMREVGQNGSASLLFLPKQTAPGAAVVRRDGVVIWAVE